MKRYGMVIGLKPGKLKEYRDYHDNIWPEILQVIERCNIRNYTIFHRNNQLFSYFEYYGNNFKQDMEIMAADEKTKEWWSIMGPMQVPEQDREEGEWWATMEEVFHND